MIQTFDEVVTILGMIFSVIPVEAGIQRFKGLLDSRPPALAGTGFIQREGGPE
jgi:hypothetical protein